MKLIFIAAVLVGMPVVAKAELTFTYSPAKGIGPQAGVMRRDPSDIVRIGDRYYVWYSKGRVYNGYDATIWYATSPDGHAWAEKGEALPRGAEGRWDAQSVFTPNLLVADRKSRTSMGFLIVGTRVTPWVLRVQRIRP